MKKQEIVLGGIYSNGKGRIRKIIDEGTHCVLFSNQQDHDCVKYEVIDDGTKNNLTKVRYGFNTRASFASWAKERITERAYE